MKTMDELAAAYTKLSDQKRVRLVNGEGKSLADVRLSLPHTSLLASYLDDFLPGGSNQYLDGKLEREAEGGWKLSIYVDTMNATGVQHYDAQGTFRFWGV